MPDLYGLSSAELKSHSYSLIETLMIAEPVASRPLIHAFDFDGTLTVRDSFTAFLLWECGHLKVGLTLLLRPYMLWRYLKTKDRGALKSHLLFNLFGPIDKFELEDKIARFVSASKSKLFRPDALTAWDALKSTDSLRVIVTASPELLVAPFGAAIGADLVIGTRLGFDSGHRLLPDLAGANCRAEEKLSRLRDTFGPDMEIESAYGDTSGDHAMIKAARHGHYRVFTGRPS